MTDLHDRERGASVLQAAHRAVACGNAAPQQSPDPLRTAAAELIALVDSTIASIGGSQPYAALSIIGEAAARLKVSLDQGAWK